MTFFQASAESRDAAATPVAIPDSVLSSLTVPQLKAELRHRDVYFPSNFRKPALRDLLKACLHLPVIRDAQQAPPVRTKKRKDNGRSPQKWNQTHPARALIYNELKKGNIPLDIKDMGPAEVFYNYMDTLEFRMEGMEMCDTFTRRLHELRKIVSKEQPLHPWNEFHPAKEAALR